VVDAAASISPISIEPESPMKILAGWKLCGKKPRQAPASTTEMTAGGENRTSPPWSRSSPTENMQIAMAVMSPSPAASPSSPSTKFIWLTMDTVRGLGQHEGADAAQWDIENAPGDPHCPQDAGRGDLAGEFRQSIQPPTVVDQTNAHDDCAGHQDRGHAGGIDEAPGQRRQLGGEEDRSEHAEEHRQPTHPRGRRHVHIAFAWV